MNVAKLASLGLLAAVVAIAGCPQETKKNEGPKKLAVTTEEGHGPHGKGPNGGVVFDLGNFHAEFSVNHDKKECTLAILGMDENTPKFVVAKDLTVNTKETKSKEGKTVPPMTIKMLPADEKDGKASKYVGTDPGLGNVAEFEGTVVGELNGKGSKGKFKEE